MAETCSFLIFGRDVGMLPTTWPEQVTGHQVVAAARDTPVQELIIQAEHARN